MKEVMSVGRVAHGLSGVVRWQGGVSSTIMACTHGYAMGYVMVLSDEFNFRISMALMQIKANTKCGYYDLVIGGLLDISYPESKNRRGRVQSNGLVSPTICTSSGIVRIEYGKEI